MKMTFYSCYASQFPNTNVKTNPFSLDKQKTDLKLLRRAGT